MNLRRFIGSISMWQPLLVGIAWGAGFPPSTPSTHEAEKPHHDHAEVIGLTNPPATALALWYRKPAANWNEALPIGNGRLGAMVYGGVADELIQLNEESIWLGYKRKNVDNPRAAAGLAKLRPLLFEHKINEAVAVVAEDIIATPPRILPYQPLGDLTIRSPGISRVTDYQRSLDLDTGIIAVRYRSGDVQFNREYFSSTTDDVIVVSLSADRSRQINIELELSRQKDAETRVEASGLVLEGQLMSQYLGDAGPVPSTRFVGQVAVLAQEGNVSSSGKKLIVEKATSVLLLISAASDFHGKEPGEVCREIISRARRKSPSALRADHIKEHQSDFRRVHLDLGRSAASARALPTDERIRQQANVTTADPELAVLLSQYGRYLLMGSSRPGTMPANLQGIWNAEWQPPWNSDFHTNINLQMNYWAAESGNLAAFHEPLFDLMELLAKTGSQTAKDMYQAHGWVVHHLTDPFGFTAPADGPQGLWPMGAAWLALHPWEHYLFSQDKVFLQQRGYPLMKGAAAFILDFLVTAPPGTAVPGKLVTVPSYSPENRFRLPDGTQSTLTYGATMDLEIIHGLLTNVITASEVLGTDEEFRARCKLALQNLAPLKISPRDGRLQEWIEDFQEVDRHHIHTAHLFALYPGNQISPRLTPELAEAARKSLEARTDQGAKSWSFTWRMALWARLLDGNRAQSQLDQLIKGHLHPNLLAGFKTNRDNFCPFQIDANLGATAGVIEMLLQSQEDEIHLLPALPAAWRNGSASGLRARGGFEISMEWGDSRLRRAVIISRAGQPARVRAARALEVFTEGTPIVARRLDPLTVEFPTEVGKSYILH